jgi:dolichyl-phosphate-mannose-protein mannosyltransferase
VERIVGLLERRPWLVGIGLVLLAAILRFPDLPTRGQWDADQGHDMLVLRSFVRDGAIPLLGPPTSIGDFHHGVLYYYLLAPVAALTAGDSPVAILATIALANTVAVGVVWWLARAIGGSLAGVVGGLLMAVSPSAIEESTFIWNPNLIALSSALALAGAWQAWTTRRPGWWLVVAVGATVTMHCHVLGTVLVPPLAALLIADARRRTPAEGRRRVLAIGLAWAAIVAVSYIPLAIHEVGHDFSESRAAADFVRSGGGEGAGPGLAVRLLFVPLRILAWPLTGLITKAPIAAMLAAGGVVALVARLAAMPDGVRRSAARWAALTLAWSSVALAIGARSLATVVPGLPNDHYHAFLDPIVFIVAGVGLAAIATRQFGGRPVGDLVAGVVVVALVGFGLATRPPPITPDGGWPLAELAGERITAVTGTRAISLVGLPALKSTDAYGYPLTRRGASMTGNEAEGAALVVLCDRLFEAAIEASCGGPAEDSAIEGFEGSPTLAARFDASPRTVVSVYLPASP